MKKKAIIAKAIEIVEEYAADYDIRLTLRQLYYQFVARGLMPNADSTYRKLTTVLTGARLNGSFPVDGLVDTGRSVSTGEYLTDKTSIPDALNEAAQAAERWPYEFLWRARWFGQPKHVSVWVEKEALSSVFAPVCKKLGVSFFACKGYPSIPALNDWLSVALGFEGRDEFGKPATRTILYFGDHDPDGWQIPRSAADNLRKLMDVRGEHFPLEVTRVALNMDQISRLSPPPFPAKKTSSRYRKYFDEHGTNDAWELDALDPGELQRLIRSEVDARFDAHVWARNQDIVDEKRDEFVREIVSNRDFLENAFL